MIRPLALGAATALLSGCGQPQLLTVDRYLAQCEGLKGKPVRLAGYLGECAGYACHLTASKQKWDAYFDALKRSAGSPGASPEGRKAQSAAWDEMQSIPMIGVGGGAAFDRQAAPFQHRYVVIAGQVAKDSCTGVGGFDRSVGIEPTDIRPWSPTKSN